MLGIHRLVMVAIRGRMSRMPLERKMQGTFGNLTHCRDHRPEQKSRETC